MPASPLKKSSIPIFLLAFVLLGTLLLFGYLWWQHERSLRVRYEAFGITLPAGNYLHGIDVSHHQHRIAWEAVRAMRAGGIGIDFVFIKATEGLQHTDRQFNRNWRKAQEVRLPRGAYHYFIPSRSGTGQAQHFLRQVQLQPGDLPPVLDVEQTNNVPRRLLQQRVQEWLDVVERATGVKPILYTNISFYERWLGNRFDRYPLWVAHYLEPRQPRTRRNWLFWQHSETGRVNGIRNAVDFNVFRGDSTQLAELLLK